MTPRALSTAMLLALVACGKKASPDAGTTPAQTVMVTTIPGHGGLAEDTSPKESPRLVPAEAYLRTYLALFGGLSPIAAQAAAQGADGSQLFDTWNDYLLALGFPDYRFDIQRQGQTNAIMVASFERVGVALCDRALEHDLLATPATPLAGRLIFAFEPPSGTVDQAAFAPAFDVLHRTFLGYPAALAPTNRVARFFQLYGDVAAAHQAPDAGKSRFTPAQAGWAACCYGLVRHPEFHLY